MCSRRWLVSVVVVRLGLQTVAQRCVVMPLAEMTIGSRQSRVCFVYKRSLSTTSPTYNPTSFFISVPCRLEKLSM